MAPGEAVRENYRQQGVEAERERIINLLESYFALTEYSEQADESEPNKEWDAGFGAALALIKGENK